MSESRTPERRSEPLPSLTGTGGAPAAAGAHRAFPQIDGYRILDRLGEGGMGVVWRAEQLSTHREVALKVLQGAALGSERSFRRFEREIEVAASFEHPNLARVYDSGLRNGVYCYAMELIDGLPLDEYVALHRLTTGKLLELMRLVCDAVQHAHQRGVIHRDLKPGNILVDQDGAPHVVDFGLAKTFEAGSADAAISIEGELAGTPAYMSPEQAAGHAQNLDTRTDVYALGVMLYRLLTGHVPHDLTGSHYEVLRRIAEEPVLRPREAKTDLNRELEAILLKALHVDPEQRYASAGDLGGDLANYLHGEPLTARKATTIYFLRKRARRHRVPIAIVCTVAAVLAVMTGAMIVRNQAADRRERQAFYFRSITAAEKAVEDAVRGNFRLARNILAQCPESLRDWEWRRIHYLMDMCRMTFDVHGARRIRIDSTDGMIVVLGDTDIARVDLRDGLLRRHRAVDADRILALDATGRTMAVAAPGEILVEATAPESSPVRIEVDGWPTCAVFDAGATRLFFVTDAGALRCFDLKNRRPAWEVALRHGPVAQVQADGEVGLVGVLSVSGVLALRDDVTGDPVTTVRDGTRLTRFTFVPGRDVVAAVVEGPDRVKFFGHGDGKPRRELSGDPAEATRIVALAASPDGRHLATGDNQCAVKLWSAAEGEHRVTWYGHRDTVQDVAFSPDGKWVVSGDARAVKVWHTTLSRYDARPCAAAEVYALKVVPAAAPRVFFGTEEGAVVRCDPVTGRVVSSSTLHAHPVQALAVHPDATWVVTGNDGGELHGFDADFRDPQHEASAHEGGVRDLAFNHDGSVLISVGHDESIRLWRTAPESGHLPRVLRPVRTLRQAGIVGSVAFSPDGAWFVTASRTGTVHVWNTAEALASDVKPRVIGAGEGERLPVFAVATAPDGDRFACATRARGGDAGRHESVIRIWHRDGRATPVSMRGHGMTINDLAYAPHGRRLASAGDDGTVRIWDTVTGEAVMTLRGHDGPVTSVAFTPDGRTVISGGKRGLIVWNSGPVEAYDSILRLEANVLLPWGGDVPLPQARHDSAESEI